MKIDIEVSKKTIIISVIAGILLGGAIHVAWNGHILLGCILAYIFGFWRAWFCEVEK